MPGELFGKISFFFISNGANNYWFYEFRRSGRKIKNIDCQEVF